MLSPRSSQVRRAAALVVALLLNVPTRPLPGPGSCRHSPAFSEACALSREAMAGRGLFMRRALGSFMPMRQVVSGMVVAAVAIPGTLWAAAQSGLQVATASATHALAAMSVPFDAVTPTRLLIQEGWTLTRYAEVYHTTVDTLMALNAGTVLNPDVIFAGRPLMVPVVDHLVVSLPALPTPAFLPSPIPLPPTPEVWGLSLDTWSSMGSFALAIFAVALASALVYGVVVLWNRSRARPTPWIGASLVAALLAWVTLALPPPRPPEPPPGAPPVVEQALEARARTLWPVPMSKRPSITPARSLASERPTRPAPLPELSWETPAEFATLGSPLPMEPAPLLPAPPPASLPDVLRSEVVAIPEPVVAPRVDASGSVKTYVNVKGQLKVMGLGRRSVVVDHEAVPGLMPAMTMSYSVDPNQLAGFVAPQAVRFTLQVTGGTQYRITQIQEDATPLPSAAVRSPRTPEEVRESLRLEPTWGRVQARQLDLAARREQEAAAVAALRQSQLGGSLRVGVGLRAQSGGLFRAGPQVSAVIPQPLSRLARHNASREAQLDEARVKADNQRSLYAQAQITLERSLLLEEGVLEGTAISAWSAWIQGLSLQAPSPAERATAAYETLLHARSAVEAAHRSRLSKLLPARWQAQGSLWPVFWAALPEWARTGRYTPDLEAAAVQAAERQWREAQFLAVQEVRGALESLRILPEEPDLRLRSDEPSAARSAQGALLRRRLEAQLLLRAWRVPATANTEEAESRVTAAFEEEWGPVRSYAQDTAAYLRQQKPRGNERTLLAALDQVSQSLPGAVLPAQALSARTGASAVAAREPVRSPLMQVEMMAGAAGLGGKARESDPRSIAMGPGGMTASAGASVTVLSAPTSSRVWSATLNRSRQSAAQAAADRAWNERWVSLKGDEIDREGLPAVLRAWKAEEEALRRGSDDENRLPVLRARIQDLEGRLARAQARVTHAEDALRLRPFHASASAEHAEASYRAALAEQSLARIQARSWTGQGMVQNPSGASTPMGLLRLDQWLTRPLTTGVKRLLNKSPQTLQDRQAQLQVRSVAWDILSDYSRIFIRHQAAQADLEGWNRLVNHLTETLHDAEASSETPAILLSRLRSELVDAELSQAQAGAHAEAAAAEDQAWDRFMNGESAEGVRALKPLIASVREGWPDALDPAPAYALAQKQADIEAFQATLSGVEGSSELFAARMNGPMGGVAWGVGALLQWNPAAVHNRGMTLQREIALLDQEAFETRQTLLRDREVAHARADVWKGLSDALRSMTLNDGLSALEKSRTVALALAYERLAVTSTLQAGGPSDIVALPPTAPIQSLTVRSESRAEFVEYVAYHCPCTDCQTPLAGVDGKTRQVGFSSFAGPLGSGLAVEGQGWTLRDAGRSRALQSEWTMARNLRTWKADDNAHAMQDRVNGFFAVQDAARLRVLETAERLRRQEIVHPDRWRQALVDYYTARADLAGANAALNRDVVEVLKALVPDSVSDVEWKREAVPSFDLVVPLETLPSSPWRTFTAQGLAEGLVSSALSSPVPSAPSGPMMNFRWPLKTLDGKAVSLSDFRGKVLVINVWATWCAPCVAEMESLERLWASFKDNPEVSFLLVSEEPPEVIRAFLQRHPHALPMYTTATAPLQALGLKGYPTTFIVSKEGERVQTLSGAQLWDAPRHLEFLKQLLQKVSPPAPTPRTLGRSA